MGLGIGSSGGVALQVAAQLNTLGVGDVGTYTVATLPDPALWGRRTAWCTDLWSDLASPGGRVVSEGGFWKPVRPLALAQRVSATSTWSCLKNAPTQIITGTIGTGLTHTITMATTNAYPGARFRTKRTATGLGTLVIVGSTLPLNSWIDHEFDGSAWVQTASGGLL